MGGMRRGLRAIETRVLPHGWLDVVRQVLLFVGAYVLYGLVRAVVHGGAWQPGYKPFGNAMKIIDFERAIHVFAEPSIQAWALNKRWLMDLADWTYLYSHYVVTVTVLIWIYLRRNDSFYFLRNTFMLAMMIALIGYAVFPTAPPRLLPEWGFTDAIQQFTGITVEKGASSAFLNLYAAVPSMHVCFGVMTGWPMVRLVRRRPAKVAWALYPLWITFVVIATGNHYFTDVFLGALTAGLSALLAKQLLARARPDVWEFAGRATPSTGRRAPRRTTAGDPATA
jgi:membrane-associated phospholipid phosphatase